MKKDIDFSVDELIEEGKKRVNSKDKYSFAWHSWPQTFGSTAGPHDGIGGQAMTEFQVFLFENTYTHECMLFCDGLWKPWDRKRGKMRKSKAVIYGSGLRKREFIEV